MCPQNIVPVNVLVTNPDGNAGKLTSAFVYCAATPTIASFSPVSGSSSGGTTVTVLGTNLRRITAVFFGTTAAACSTIAQLSNGFTVTAPPGCGSQRITIQTADDRSTTSTGTYTYNPTAPSGLGSTLTNNVWQCAAGTYHLTFAVAVGGGTPCDDIPASGISLTIVYRDGSQQHNLTPNTSQSTVLYTEANGHRVANISVPVTENCPSGANTEYFYYGTITVTTNAGLSTTATDIPYAMWGVAPSS